MTKYSQELIELSKNENNRVISSKIRLDMHLKELLIHETNFLVGYKFSTTERMWYVKNNIHEQLKCPNCKKPTKLNAKLLIPSYCSQYCFAYHKDPITGLTNAEIRGEKSKNSNLKVGDSGLNNYQKLGQHNKNLYNKINPKNRIV